MEARKQHFFDWRFLVALSFLILVVVGTWGFLDRQRQIDGLTSGLTASEAHVSELVEQVSDLNTQVDNLLRAQQSAERRSKALLRKNQKQTDQIRRQTEEIAALIRLFESRGFQIPPSVLAPFQTSDGGSGHHPKSTAGQPPPQPVPGSPAPTPAPTPPNADPVCELAPLICQIPLPPKGT